MASNWFGFNGLPFLLYFFFTELLWTPKHNALQPPPDQKNKVIELTQFTKKISDGYGKKKATCIWNKPVGPTGVLWKTKVAATRRGVPFSRACAGARVCVCEPSSQCWQPVWPFNDLDAREPTTMSTRQKKKKKWGVGVDRFDTFHACERHTCFIYLFN